ncbi:type VI immunity family protein [Mixta intestinalis]|uniref:DUF3396 domain-containing protein n=1 Tax=Mixta intestinalis TaxID=1615494 RepID=A0A6P1PY30_9GAMM|nr:type VI immunity family protein [Mixta intestinalis]QHM71253.1 hypothetical protein C7M51_01538 [Mixta intestinalis]
MPESVRLCRGEKIIAWLSVTAKLARRPNGLSVSQVMFCGIVEGLMKKETESLRELLPDDHNLAQLDQIAVKGKNTIRARIALGVELFIPPREQRQLYPALNQLAEDYYRRFAPWLNSYSLSGSSRVSLMRKDFLKKLANKMANLNYEASYDTHLFYDDTGQGKIFNASPWQARFYGCGVNREDSLSSVVASIPVCDEQGNPYFDTLLEMVLQWCNVVKPAFGTAGFCFSCSGPPSARYTWPLLQRHPGLDHMDDISFLVATTYVEDKKRKYITNRIKGVNWLTVLGDALVEELGGLDRCREALEPECHVQPYDGGIVIMAGPMPQLGDTYQGIVPQRYRKVAAFTRPIRFEDYDGELIDVDEPLDSREATLQWIRRFDD